MTGLASDSWDDFQIEYNDIDARLTTAYGKFTPPGEFSQYRSMKLLRDVSSEDVETQELNVMPGFKFSWWYNGAEVTINNIFKVEKMNQQFVR